MNWLKRLFAKRTDKDASVKIYVDAIAYDLPRDLVDIIYELKQFKHYSEQEYAHILQGANLAYHNQSLLGRKLPLDHPKSIEVSQALINLGVSIQYHPNHGMIIVDTDYK
jgi:hypothetical protein